MLQLSQARSHSQAPASLRVFLALLAASLLSSVVPAHVDASSSSLTGQPAPDFALRSLGSDNVRLSEHLGEVVVLNFWATWCGPCRQEMPLLDELYHRYRRAGMVLFSINVDEHRDEAVEMARTLKVSYPVLFDERKEVSRAYQVGTMPVTVLIDRAGVVRYVSEGYKPGYEKRYTDKLRELLNE
jgi:thiol-disulfide isomerase/thioredoxin